MSQTRLSSSLALRFAVAVVPVIESRQALDMVMDGSVVQARTVTGRRDSCCVLGAGDDSRRGIRSRRDMTVAISWLCGDCRWILCLCVVGLMDSVYLPAAMVRFTLKVELLRELRTKQPRSCLKIGWPPTYMRGTAGSLS